MPTDSNLIVNKHYPVLDGLRGVACLMVIWFHSSYLSGAINSDVPFIYYNISFIGQLGVDLFFVLSGFLITGILVDTANSKHALKTFYIRRSLRIFPVYYCFLILFGMTLYFSLGTSELKNIWLYVFYVQNFSLSYQNDSYQYLVHTWSLAVEEQFYLIWPIVFLAAYRKSVKAALKLCLCLFFVSVFLRIFLTQMELSKLAYTLMFSHMDGLLAGAALSILFRHHRSELDQYQNIIKMMAVVFAVIMLVLFMSLGNVSLAIVGPQAVSASLLFCCILALVMISDDRNIWSQILSSKMLRHVGRVSYGLYIFHFPVMNFMGYRLYDYQLGFWENHIILLILGAGVAYVISVLSYKVYEKPILLLKDKLAPNSAP